MKQTTILLAASILLLSGCLRTSQDTAPTQQDWAAISVQNATATTTTTSLAIVEENSTTSTTIDYKKLYELLANRTSIATTSTTESTSTTTSSSTTTTSLKKRLIQLPAKIKLQESWTLCNKSRDCTIVTDCCGWDYGYKYAINTGSENNFAHFITTWCASRDHRTGCGWSMPRITQATCEKGVCKPYYGGIEQDDLIDSGFNYTFDWVGNNKLMNKTNDGLIPGGRYDGATE